MTNPAQPMTNDPNWLLVGASVRGHAHVADGRPGQDAHRLDWHGAFGLAVVCDGAGSASHADEGARQTALLCEYHFGKLIRETGWATTNLANQPTPPDATRWHNEAKATLHAVRDDLEKISLDLDVPLGALACTVIVAVFTDNWLLISHIGDGRAGVCRAEGPWKAALIPFHGAEANETVFITSDIWQPERVDLFVESRVIPGPIRAVCLLSDGCEKATFACNLYDPDRDLYHDPNLPFAPFFEPVIAQITSLYDAGRTRAEIETDWAAFLTDGHERFRTEPDDKTLLLAVRHAAQSTPTDG